LNIEQGTRKEENIEQGARNKEGVMRNIEQGIFELMIREIGIRYFVPCSAFYC